jgi:biotin synthase
MPRTIIRLAAGRTTLSEEQQVLCFMAGANAVFTGEKMLTTACNGWDEDKRIFEKWGLQPMQSFQTGLQPDASVPMQQGIEEKKQQDLESR